MRIENQVEFLEKLVNSLFLRGATKNALLGLSKPPAMRMVMIFVTFISTTVFTDAKDSKIIKSPNEYFSDRNVEIIPTVSENKIQLARQWDVLLYQGFDEYVENQKHQKDIDRTNIFKWEYASPDNWKFTNYKNTLKASISNDKDTHNAYLVISGSDKGGDTAFELSSPMIPVEAGKSYTLTFRCQLSKKLVAQRGFKGKYETGIIWLSSDNKKIDETPFSLLNENDVYKDWSTRKIDVISPERATKAMIRFGFDLPNLGPGDFVCFDDIRFATLSNRYEPEGEFISRPLSIESGNLSLIAANADIPQGTSIQFQLRFAADNNGVPGTWTSFLDHNPMTTPQTPPSEGGDKGEVKNQILPISPSQGRDFVVSAQSNDKGEVKSRLSSSLPSQEKEEGLLIPPFARDRGGVIDYPPSIPPFARGDTGGCKINFPEKEVFTQEAYRWLQYRAIFHTTKPDTTPALHSVIINSAKGTSITDSGWSRPDTTPPEIVWRSPTRTEQAGVPIAFHLCDNPGGLGIKSVEAYLDGKKVELLQGKSSRSKGSQKSMEIFHPPLIPSIPSASLRTGKGGKVSSPVSVHPPPLTPPTRGRGNPSSTQIGETLPTPIPLIKGEKGGSGRSGGEAELLSSPLVGEGLGEGCFRIESNEYTLKTTGPLKPLERDTGLSAWKIENYQNALAVERSPEIITFINTSERSSYVDTAFKMCSPKIPVIENTGYVLSFCSRHNSDLTDIKHWGNISSGIIWRDRNGKEIGEPYSVSFGTAHMKWHRDVHKVKSPSGAVSAEICFGWDSPNLNNGEYFSIKDVCLDGPRPEIPCGPNLHKIEVKACDLAGNTMQKTWYVLVKKFPTENIIGQHGRNQKEFNHEEKLPKTCPQENMSPSLNSSHSFGFAQDRQGREGSSPLAGEGQGEGYFPANTIRLRDDGMTLIDNKPFFPIGIYAVQKSKVNNFNLDNAFKELKDAGFNTAHTYMKERNNDFTEFYSTAARYGMKVFVMTSAGHNSTDIDTIVHDVASEVDQPALLSWYLADDTSSYISSKDLKNIHEIIKDIDPYHLTSQADGVVGFANRCQRYADATDIFLPELYPVRTKGKNEIAELIRDMKHVKEGLARSGCNQGIWAIVQDFKGWGWQRYPTHEELRAMTYLSIIHGATGITYYTYGGWGENFGAPFDRHVWANLKKVVGEIAYLHAVLAERNTKEYCTSLILEGAQKDGMGYPALNTLLKVHHGKHYLFTVNSAQEAIRCQFKPAKLPAGQKKAQYQLMPATENISEVSVVFEYRTLPVKDGVFADDFGAYEVHVYQW